MPRGGHRTADGRRRVLACLDMTTGAEATTEFAISEAVRRGCGLSVVVLARTGWEPGSGVRLLDDLGVGRAYAARGEVSLDVLRSPVLPALLQRCDGALLVVLSRPRRKHAMRGLSRSLVKDLAAWSSVPVVVVPEAWSAAAHERVVAVGVEDALSSGAVARWAFEEARRLHCPVRLVRAWFFSSVLEAQVRGRAAEVESACVREEVRRAFTELAGLFADVRCEVVARHGQPADVLVAESREVRALVVGRHDPSLPWGSRLGPVTRRVVDRAACPVTVVDPQGGRS